MKLSEVKPELESCKRENAKLKAQIERERSRADRAQVSADNREGILKPGMPVEAQLDAGR